MRPAFLLVVFSCSFAVGQERSDVRLHPPQPEQGLPITLTYRPDRAFTPASGEPVVAEILAAGSAPRVYDVPMQKRSGAYTGSWTPPSGTEAIVLRVAVANRVDDRDGLGWAAVVKGPDDAAMQRTGSWLAKAGASGGLYGFRARVEHLSSTADGSDVRGPALQETDWNAAVAHADAGERWSALATYLEKHPDPTDEAKVHVLVRSAIAAKAWDAADEVIHRQPRKEPLWLIALAEGLMRANVTLDRASVLAKESVNAARNWDPARKPALLSLREFRNQRASEVPLALRTYARSLVRLGYPALAEKVYAEAYDALDGRDPDVKNEYVAVLRTLGKTSRIEEVEQTFTR